MKNSLNKNRKLSFTVGITTCYGNMSILDTVKSIRNSKGVGDFRFIIVADRNPIKPTLKKGLKKFDVELHENKVESGQIRKKKQILDMCNSDIIIYTQDDVIFEPYSLLKIIKAFEDNPKTTFVSIKNEVVKPNSFFEKVITVGTRLAEGIGRYWNNGENYLSVVGRCEAFKVDFAKKNFRFIDKVVSTDAFFYFENKKHRGQHVHLKDAKLIFRNPRHLKEYLRKSSRFQHSNHEMLKYFDEKILDYSIPKKTVFKAFRDEFIKNPVTFFSYILLFIYTRIAKIKRSESLNSIWENDPSTKKVLTNKS